MWQVPNWNRNFCKKNKYIVHLRIAEQDDCRAKEVVGCAQAVLEQDELHHVVDLLEVDLGQHHVDRVGGGED